MKIHCIGIGGIGVSALAQYYLAKGYEVSGCDLVRSEITGHLAKQGMKIRIGRPQALCSRSADLVVYSPAVKASHPELKGKKALSYPEALGELTRQHYTIAVSGTHGKSTTSSMIGLMLCNAGLDPTVIVGTRLKEFGGSNFRMGRGKYLVIEADEHFASFLNYRPSVIVLTAVDEDHLDYYKNLKNIIATFKKYVSLLPSKGILVANRDDLNIRKIAGRRKTLWYSLQQKEAKNISRVIGIPGSHNVSNGLAVLAVARTLGVRDSLVYKTLARYQGSWRRFEVFKMRTPRPDTLVSDYGHHPTEIKVTVQAAREKWPRKKLWLVFQPHQYQRTYYLWKDFVRVLSSLPVQKLILTDIYDVAGREETNIREKVSSEKLARMVKGTVYIPSISDVPGYLEKNLKGGEVVMVMGAGNIYNLTLGLRSKNET